MPICRIKVGELPAHGVAQARIEIGQRLVEQEEARPPHDGARQRHPLLLPAREPRRRPPRHRLHPDQREHIHHPLLDFRARDAGAGDRERIGDVVEDVEMRPDRVGLEHHSDRALVHGDEMIRIRDHASADGDRPLLGLIETGDTAQYRGLAAAARTEQRVALRLGHAEAHMVDGFDGALGSDEGLRESGYGEHGHSATARRAKVRRATKMTGNTTATMIDASAAEGAGCPDWNSCHNSTESTTLSGL